MVLAVVVCIRSSKPPQKVNNANLGLSVTPKVAQCDQEENCFSASGEEKLVLPSSVSLESSTLHHLAILFSAFPLFVFSQKWVTQQKGPHLVSYPRP